MEFEERFWSKVDWNIHEPDRCWSWLGATFSTTGYGAFSVAGAACYAHRVAYELEVGEIPEGLVVDHACDNRVCVNPAHLRVVTQQENILRGNGMSARNARKTECPTCHGPYQTKKRGGRFCRPCESRKEKVRYHERKARLG